MDNRKKKRQSDTPEQLLNRLVSNAMDFLQHAIAEFQPNPKYSIIHFYAAVELFLKARLMVEHWSLVVADRSDPDWKKFVQGDFQSVTLLQAAAKLEKAVQSGLTDDEFSAFRAVANHRNRAIHFFHTAHTDEEAKQQLRAIAKEQLIAWHRLHRLLQTRWKAQFEGWQPQLDEIESKLKGHRAFLELIYQEVGPQLSEALNRGFDVQSCSACSFDAVVHDTDLNTPYEAPCLVCGLSDRCMTIECPDCQARVTFENDGWTTCEGCGRGLEPDDLADALEDKGAVYIATKEGDSSWDRGNCADCDGYHTVVRTSDDQWIATCCLVAHDSIDVCHWCNEPNTGNMELSYHSGCSMCDGRAGWERDN